MTSQRLGEIAAVLGMAWDNASTVPAPSTTDPWLTPEDAYKIQDVIVADRLSRGKHPAGWKLGLTSAGAGTTPIVGTLLDDMVIQSGDRLSLKKMVAPLVEAEIIVQIGETLEKPITMSELVAGPHKVGPGLEIIDYRTVNSSNPVDWIADNSTVGFAVAGDLVPIDAVDPPGIEVVLSDQRGHLASGKGALVMGNPIQAVSWLSGHLISRGRRLEEGDLVLTGSITGHHRVITGVSSEFHADFGELGSVDVGFDS